jgi:hypothetical protein
LTLAIRAAAQSLAVLARGRGIIFRRDFATGGALPNILSVPSRDCQGGQTTTGMRDITFSPEGDAYLRVDNSIFYAQRTGMTPSRSIAPAKSLTSAWTTPSKC